MKGDMKMKTARRLFAVLLTLALLLAAAIPAFAEDGADSTGSGSSTAQNTVTVTVAETLENHTFVAYQIFAGTQQESEGALGDVEWGSGVNGTALLTRLKEEEEKEKNGEDTAIGSAFTECETAEDVAEVLMMRSNDGDFANAFARLVYESKTGEGTALTAGENTLAKGYYLIVDTTEIESTEDGVQNAALLQVTDTITISDKTSQPTVEKKVKENTKYQDSTENTYGTGYNDVADYSIGDAVPFHLIGTVPDMRNYETYQYVFHDTLSAGLTAPEAGSIKVYLSHDKIRNDTDTEITDAFSITVSGQEITVSCSDLKQTDYFPNEGDYIIVEYSAVLNANAEIGLDGNTNKVYLTYSNKPNDSGSDDPNDSGSTNNTPEDVVIVFTYQMNVTKIDGSTAGETTPTTLKGAEFVLYRTVKKKVDETVEQTTCYYAQTDADGKVTGWTTDKAQATTLTTGDDGTVKITGLDHGTYYLEETKAPAGYNKLTDPVAIAVEANTVHNQTWKGEANMALTALEVKVDQADDQAGNTQDGTVAVTVANNRGATLPETGGMGTTLFYLVGCGLMAGAAVLLITGKRIRR